MSSKEQKVFVDTSDSDNQLAGFQTGVFSAELIAGLRVLAMHTMGDAAALGLDSFYSPIFKDGYSRLQLMDKLETPLAAALAGSNEVFGSQNGVSAKLAPASLPILDALAAQLNRSLGDAVGVLPPSPGNFGAFYSTVAHSFPKTAEPCARIIGGATNMSLAIMERMVDVKFFKQFASSEQFGGLAFGNVALTGMTSLYALDALTGQAMGSEAAFSAMSLPLAEVQTGVSGSAVGQFVQTLPLLYGDLGQTGFLFAMGIEGNMKLDGVIAHAFDVGFLLFDGPPGSQFKIFKLSLGNNLGGTYDLHAFTQPVLASVLLKVCVVDGADGLISVATALTDAVGEAVFVGIPKGPQNTYHAVLVADPAGTAQGSMQIQF